MKKVFLISNVLLLGSFVAACADIDPKMANDYQPTVSEHTSGEITQLDYGELLAFPGAQGHGRNVTGGRGGTVYHVTSLADDGSAGTLRYAMERSGARIVVFDVSGTIHLTRQLNTRNNDLTIAGQTSPGGICIADYPIVINSSNVIIRFLRFRMGINNVSDGKAVDADALGGMDGSNVIVDHCSVSWSTDECLSVYGMVNSTVQWCMAYQALRVTSAKDGSHGYGGNWGGRYASYHHNLIAHCESRVPRLGPRYTTLALGELVDIRNNVFYNYNGEGCYGGEAQHTNLVNNYYKPGPATADRRLNRIFKPDVYPADYSGAADYGTWLLTWGKFYITGNTIEGNEDVSNDNWTDGVWGQMDAGNSGGESSSVWASRTEIQSTTPVVEAGNVTTSSAADAYTKVIALAGACNYRDVLDTFIMNEVQNGTATCSSADNSTGYINDPQDLVGKIDGLTDSPFPTLATDATRNMTDTDGDGIPDEWETAYGLDPDYAADGAETTIDVNGQYTNVEMYMNSLVKNIMDQCVEGEVTE